MANIIRVFARRLKGVIKYIPNPSMVKKAIRIIFRIVFTVLPFTASVQALGVEGRFTTVIAEHVIEEIIPLTISSEDA